MTPNGHDIIVIGTSAGGMEALDQLIGQLPTGLPAAIFIVQHLHPEHSASGLLHRLGQNKAFHCKLAEEGEAFKQGIIYLAPPDAHLLIGETTLLVRRGARENRYRPAVDPLFRSAAVAHGPRVVGVVLTGMLDDGTAGLLAIHRCGGVTVVQDPSEAPYPEMPQSALKNDHVDYCVPLAEMGGLLERLSHESPKKSGPIPSDLLIESEIAERVLCGIEGMDRLGPMVPYTCPSCGGTLWETKDTDRYRCHTGHTFTAETLLADQSEKIEETLWIALRMFEERNNLQKVRALKEKSPRMKQIYEKNISETEEHIERIRGLLLAENKEDADKLNAEHK
jgi:two-component system chemotaxis response regulator CheB